MRSIDSVVRVAAVIVTYNDPDALRTCVASLDRQQRPPDLVIVVDNASEPPIGGLDAACKIEVVRSPSNGGPAGGFALGLEAFLSSGCDFAWAMDDDCVADERALELLLEESDEGTVLLPELVVNGRSDWRPAWSGVLIPRPVVQTVGVPRRDFVWWAEDTEYLQWRIPTAGFAVKNSAARVVTETPRRALRKPGWKYYYEARNSVYLRLRIKKTHRPRRLARIIVRVPIAIVARGDRRGNALLMHSRGVIDGIIGRLGLTVPLD